VNSVPVILVEVCGFEFMMEAWHIEDDFTAWGLPDLDISPFFVIETILIGVALVVTVSAPCVVPFMTHMEDGSSYLV